MADRETLKGPYQMWLWHARRRVGERVWEHVIRLPCSDADAILRSLGVMPFLESEEHWEWIQACLDGNASVDVEIESWEPTKGYQPSPRQVSRDPGAGLRRREIEE